MNHSERLEHYHNKGQEDYAEDKGFNPPWGSLIHDLLGKSDKDIECDKAYTEGWRHAREQD